MGVKRRLSVGEDLWHEAGGGGSGGEVEWQQGPGPTSCATLKNRLEGTGNLTAFKQGLDGI